MKREVITVRQRAGPWTLLELKFPVTLRFKLADAVPGGPGALAEPASGVHHGVLERSELGQGLGVLRELRGEGPASGLAMNLKVKGRASAPLAVTRNQLSRSRRLAHRHRDSDPLQVPASRCPGRRSRARVAGHRVSLSAVTLTESRSG